MSWARFRRHIFRSHTPGFVTVSALRVRQLVIVRYVNDPGTLFKS